MSRPQLEAVAALLAALGAGCGNPPPLPLVAGGPVDFTVGTLSVHFSSGAAAVVGGVLTLYLVDLPSACTVIGNSRTGNPPVGTLTTLTLRVTAASDGTTVATVVAPTPVPGPGKAAGGLSRTLSGQQTNALDLTDGTVSWTADSAGNVTINSLDLGFAASVGRITTHDLFLQQCSL